MMWKYTLVIKGKYDRADDLPKEAFDILRRGPKQDEVVCPNIKKHQFFHETFVTFTSDWNYIDELNHYFCDLEKYGDSPACRDGALLFYSVSREY